MKAAFFSLVRYLGPMTMQWPAPADDFTPEMATRSMQAAMDQYQLADEVGFDWVTLAEHHFGPTSLTPNPMILAAAVSQVVKRARIAILGANIPILNPVRVAEEFAMLDAITGGRIIAGMLRGSPQEYITYNINPAELRARFNEALELIRTAWTEKNPFGWQGRYYEYRTISVWPRPVQQPHPPIYISGSSPEGAEYAARNGLSIGIAQTPLALGVKSATLYRQTAREAGWEPDDDHVLFRVNFHVAETDEQALADLYEDAGRRPAGRNSWSADVEKAIATAGYYGRDQEEQRVRHHAGDIETRIERGQLLLGSPDTVFRQIERIHRELRPGILDASLAARLGPKSNKAIELFGSKVLPRMHALN